MAMNGNERYLRYILLLGEGILLVLRGITKREVAITGSTLKAILAIPSNRIRLERNCSSSVQRLQLFPSPVAVNEDINTWDISILTLVLERVFWSNLSQSERLQIGYLRDCRNALQGHPPAMSMDETFYVTRLSDLSSVLQNLASRINQQTTDELARIINNSNSVRFDFHAAIDTLQQLYEFKADMLREIENQFKAVDNKLDVMQAEDKQTMRDIATMQGHMHDDVLDIKAQGAEHSAVAREVVQAVADMKDDVNMMEQSHKERHGHIGSQLQGLQIAAESSKHEMAEIKDLAARPNILCEDDRNSLGRIEKKLEELLSQRSRNRREMQQDVNTVMDIDSDTPEHAADAQDMIIAKISDIIGKIRPDVLNKAEEIEVLKEKVKEIVTEDEGSNYELTLALLDLVKNITQHGSIQRVGKGSIKMIVRFISYESLLNFIQYLNSRKFQQSLNDISSALTRRTGHKVSLSAHIAQESLVDLHTHLDDECEKLRRTRSVVLPVQCKSIDDVNNIWSMIQKGGATEHMERISEILTKVVGGKTTVTTSVDLKQFEEALQKIRDTKLSFDIEQTKCVQGGTGSDRFAYESDAARTISTEEHSPNIADPRIPLLAESLHSKYQDQSEKGRPAAQARGSLLICKSVKKYSVKDGSDRKTPFIYGFSAIPTGEILLVDKNNKKLKKLESGYKLVNYCDLHSTPLDVCYVGNDRAAVSLATNTIQFANVLGEISLERSVKCDHICTGLACYDDILYVTDSSSTVNAYTTDGAEKRVLSKMEDEHIMIKHITTSDDGEMIYITTKKLGLVTIDKKGEHVSTLQTDILNFPNDVCVVGDGTILVSDFYSDNVLQVDYRGAQILKNVVTLTPNLKFSQKLLCYDRLQSKLIAGGFNEYIQVFEFQN